MHKFIISGRVSKKPELIKGDNYEKVHLNIGSDKSVKKGDSWERGTAWNSVTVFGKQAANCARYLEKGQHVTVEGTIENVKKEDTFQTYLTAREVEFGPKAAKSGAAKAPEADLDSIPF